MSIGKRVAYIKGLARGLEIDESAKEGKVLIEIIDVLEDIAHEIEELQEDVNTLDDEICAVSDDLEQVEDLIYGDLEDEDEEPVFYEVKCPSCNNEITIDEEVLDLGSIECPNCKETLEFDLDSIDEGCGCEH